MWYEKERMVIMRSHGDADIHLFDRLEISKNTSGEITMETNLSFFADE